MASISSLFPAVATPSSDHLFLDKCTVCDLPGSKTCGACELVFYCSKEHQREDWPKHKKQCSKLEVRKHDHHGFCFVARKPIKAGETIATEYPLAVFKALHSDENEGHLLQRIFSLSSARSYLCPSCGIGKIFTDSFHACSKCGVPLCKKECEKGLHGQVECPALQSAGAVAKVDENESISDILTDLAVLRIFLQEERKGTPISFENRRWKPLLKVIFTEKLHGEDLNFDYAEVPLSDDIVASLDAVDRLPLSLKVTGNKELVILIHCALTVYGNAFPYANPRMRYLFTKSHRMSHSCLPNASMWMENEGRNNRLIIKAVRNIPPGKRITINKGEAFNFLPTILRRERLQIDGIYCRCKRCKDASELGTFPSAVRCEESLGPSSCTGHYLPENPLNGKTKWKCTTDNCKSTKTFIEIRNMVNNLEEEIPAVTACNGRADEIIQKLKDFNQFYNRDVLCSSHYLLRIARTRVRQVVKHFLGSDEKMLLCVVNDLPRAFEYCNLLLKSLESLSFFVDKMYPNYSHVKAAILQEKAVCKLSIALHEFLVTKTTKVVSVTQKLCSVKTLLKKALEAVSIFTHEPVEAFREDVQFFLSLLDKIMQHPDQASNIGKSLLDILEDRLTKAKSGWQAMAKEIGLVTMYMEPSTCGKKLSKEALREIIVSNL